MPINLICLDADDTLWHNMRHFERTEHALFDLLAPFAEAGVTRARLEEVEARNLRLYGYGAKGFTLSMIETAIEIAGDELPIAAVRRMLAAGRELLSHPVDLLPGVEMAVRALAERGRLVLVTKGDLLHQESKLAASGLGDLFEGIEIVSDKTPELFRQLFAKYGVEAQEAVMAGDSMRSDVLPALEAGAFAAYIPHEIVWSHENAAPPAETDRFRKLASLTELANWVVELDGR